MDDLVNNSNDIDNRIIPERNVSMFKNFIAFRKDVRNNKINNSFCIIENDYKKISIDLVKNEDFLEKSNLKVNIDAIREKFYPRIKSAKNKTNNDFWEKIDLITEEKECINNPNSYNPTDINKKITETNYKTKYRPEDHVNNFYEDSKIKYQLIYDYPNSNETRSKRNYESIKDKRRRSSILDKKSLCNLEKEINEKNHSVINQNNKINVDKIGLETIFNENKIDYNITSKKNINTDHKKDKNIINNLNGVLLSRDCKEIDENICLNNNYQEFIYEQLNGTDKKIKHEKINSEAEILISNKEENDKFNKEMMNSNKVLQMDGEFIGSKSDQVFKQIDKSLFTEENQILSSQENMNPNKEIFSLNREKIIKKTLTLINNPQTNIKCQKEEISKRNKTEYVYNNRLHLNLDNIRSNNKIDKFIVINSHRSRGQRSEEKVGNQCNVTIEENSIIYPFRFCYLCDNLYQIDLVYNSETCNHSICQKCLKCFMEYKIDQNDLLIKCPIFTCCGKYKNELVKDLISQSHYRQLGYKFLNSKSDEKNIIFFKNDKKELSFENNQKGINSLRNINEKKENGLDIIKNKYNLKCDQVNNYKNLILQENEPPTNLNTNLNMKSYSRKNIVEVNNDLNEFYFFNKNRENYCKKCNELSLFIRPGKNSAKCLNCFATYCRYCLKPISYDHFDLNSFNYCKVYFRRKLKILSYKNNLNKFKNAIISFLMIIASYIIFFLNSFNYLSKVLRFIMKIDHYGNRLTYFYFINKINYNKYENIKNYFEEKKDILKNKNSKEDENNFDNRLPSYRMLKNNVLINVGKKDHMTINYYNLKEQGLAKNNEDIINLKFPLLIENQKINADSLFSDIRLLDKNLLNLLKSKISLGESIGILKLRKILSLPDNRGAFYFKDIYENENHLTNDNKKLKSAECSNEIKLMKFMNRTDDHIILKTIRYFFYYLLSIIFGIVLFFFSLTIIPYFPLLILIFQI